MRKPEPTPVTPEGLRSLDALPPAQAALSAWSDAGPNPRWHHAQQAKVRREMPLLARALDRAAGYSVTDDSYGA